jgi:hypothetical protein
MFRRTSGRLAWEGGGRERLGKGRRGRWRWEEVAYGDATDAAEVVGVGGGELPGPGCDEGGAKEGDFHGGGT